MASMVRLVGSSVQVPPWASILAAPMSTVSPEVSICPPAPLGPCASSVPATWAVPASATSQILPPPLVPTPVARITPAVSPASA